jgi:hypothetical protein
LLLLKNCAHATALVVATEERRERAVGAHQGDYGRRGFSFDLQCARHGDLSCVVNIGTRRPESSLALRFPFKMLRSGGLFRVLSIYRSTKHGSAQNQQPDAGQQTKIAGPRQPKEGTSPAQQADAVVQTSSAGHGQL